MPKAPKSPLDEKAKQITDFFPRKSLSQTSTTSSIASPGGATQKAFAKQDATQRLRSRAKAPQGNADSSKSVKKPDSQRAGSGASQSTKVVQTGASPMPPATKRLRSQSIVSPQRVKQSKRSKNILYECDYDTTMDVDDDSVVYVRPVHSTLPVPLPSPHLTAANTREAELPEKQGFLFHHSEDAAFVPSSVSEERELGPKFLKEKTENVKGGTGQPQKQDLPSLETDGNSRSRLGIQTQCVPQVPANSAVDWDMDSGITGVSTTLSRPTTVTSITGPSSTDEPAAPSTSPPALLDEKSRAEQIIKEIRLKARAFAQAQESSPPVLEIPSPITSDDDDDDDVGGLAAMNFRPSAKLESPMKPKRYNLRKPSARPTSDKQKTTSGSPSCSPPPIKRKSPTANPLDALLKEKRTTNVKSGMVSEDRESRLRALAYLDLNDDSEDDESFKNTKISIGSIKEDNGNPFIDDKQKQHVIDILESDKVIESEEEHIRQLGNVGAKLWDNSEACLMSSYVDRLPPIEYGGSDPSVLLLVQTIADGDHALIRVIMDSGALEMADYTDGGENVIGFMMDLALSYRNDTLSLSACRLLTHVVRKLTVPVPLLERMFVLLHILGAQSSILERMGWVVRNGQRGVSNGERSSVIERLILLIAETARACRLNMGEIPDIIAILLLIGLEPSVSHEMRLHISHTIHQACQCIGESCKVEIEVETAICNKVLRLVQPFSPQNKLFTLDLLAGASGRTTRVARSIAHSILTDKSTLLPSQYSALPPLSELMIMLSTVSSPSSLHPVGKFEIHDATDYVDMASWTSILAVALTDIFQYVESGEANKIAASPSTTKSPTKERDGSIIHALHDKLYKIHNRIQDSRAAHLDRSRTKAILFQLAFRVLYQYQAVNQNRKKNIQNYFHRKQLPA